MNEEREERSIDTAQSNWIEKDEATKENVAGSQRTR